MKPENFSRTLGLECSWRSDRLCRPAVVWSVKALRLRELCERERAGGERSAPAVLEQRPKTPSTPALSRGSQRPHSQPFVTVAFQGAQPLTGVRGCGWSEGGGRVFVDQLAWERPPESYREHFREKVGWARGLRARGLWTLTRSKLSVSKGKEYLKEFVDSIVLAWIDGWQLLFDADFIYT